MGTIMSSGACCLWRVQLQCRRCVRKVAEQHLSVACIHQPDVWCRLEEFPGARTVSAFWNVKRRERFTSAVRTGNVGRACHNVAPPLLLCVRPVRICSVRPETGG